MAFLVSGARNETLDVLGQHISFSVGRSKEDADFRLLCDIYRYFFGILLEVNPNYEPLEPQEGDTFDYTTMSRAPIGNDDCGRVQNVLYPGYRSAMSGKIMQKPLVVVRR